MRLRAVFGWMTIVCILLAIFRRLIVLAVDECSADWWHCVCAPWYADMYLLGFESYWPFEGGTEDFTKFENKYRDLYMVTLTISAIVWMVIHVVAAIVAGGIIHWMFFQEPEEVIEDNAEEEPTASTG